MLKRKAEMYYNNDKILAYSPPLLQSPENVQKHTHTHTHTLSLSLSLSVVVISDVCVAERGVCWVFLSQGSAPNITAGGPRFSPTQGSGDVGVQDTHHITANELTISPLGLMHTRTHTHTHSIYTSDQKYRRKQ